MRSFRGMRTLWHPLPVERTSRRGACREVVHTLPHVYGSRPRQNVWSAPDDEVWNMADLLLADLRFPFCVPRCAVVSEVSACVAFNCQRCVSFRLLLFLLLFFRSFSLSLSLFCLFFPQLKDWESTNRVKFSKSRDSYNMKTESLSVSVSRSLSVYLSLSLSLSVCLPLSPPPSLSLSLPPLSPLPSLSLTLSPFLSQWLSSSGRIYLVF